VLCDSEVGEAWISALFEDDVFRLDVLVDDALRVYVFERDDDGGGDKAWVGKGVRISSWWKCSL
jgi:hypothetical protein